MSNDEIVHVTRDGTEIPLSKLDNIHLLNILRYMRKRAKEGVDVCVTPYGAWDDNEIWPTFVTYYGIEALEFLCYDEYLEEAKRRNLKMITHI